jgi:hypothetical protein
MIKFSEPKVAPDRLNRKCHMNFAAVCHQIKAAKHVDRRYWWIAFIDTSKELLLFDVSTVFRRFVVIVGLS